MMAYVLAPGVNAIVVADSPDLLADSTADILDDAELKGGIFTLAIRNASESGVALKVDVILYPGSIRVDLKLTPPPAHQD